MGCASSKRVEATIDVYRPAPASFAVFDINSIEEPWLKAADVAQRERQEKPNNVPAPILEKLRSFESDAPHSWEEVSKALEDIKPSLQDPAGEKPDPLNPPAVAETKMAPRKSFSFHTLEDLERKSTPKPTNDSKRNEAPAPERTGAEGLKPVKENIFVLRDRLERGKEGKKVNWERGVSKRDPLSDFPERCPPGGADSVVLYTTSLRGVRRTYEDCNRARAALEVHRVVFDERDVSLHGEFLSELKSLAGEGESVPRVFVKGRYLGGVEELVALNESGRLGRILSWARVERGVGPQGCEGCGGARFVPCLHCGGSCKVLVGDQKERCAKCNENGLVRCPLCA